MRFESDAIHAGQRPDPTTGAIVTPIYQTSNYALEGPGKDKGYIYSRIGNPTRAAAEGNLAALEGGRFGFAYASGVGAATALLHMLAPGEHVLATRDLYGGNHRLLRHFEERGIGLSLVDTTDPAAIEEGFRKETRLLWLETPSNPLLRITDLAAACAAARERKVLAVVDNTFATPFLQRPMDLGADVVLHSTTKYLGGHSDAIGGALIVSDEALRDRLGKLQATLGGGAAPFDSFLVLRGIKTLHVRMERHCANALAVAKHLAKHPAVVRVHSPALPDHPQHALAARQMPRGVGGIVTFELESADAAVAFVSATRLFTLAESLGGVESLVGIPWTMSHGAIPADEKTAMGITEGMVRLSVGIEHVDDLVEDLDAALKRI